MIAKALTDGEPLGEGENLVGRTSLESARTTVVFVGREVHRGVALLAAVGLVVDAVFGHSQDAASASLHRNGRRANVVLIGWWHPFHCGIVGSLLHIHVHAGVNLKSASAKQVFAVFRGRSKFLVVTNGPDRKVTVERSYLVTFTTAWGVSEVGFNWSVFRGVSLFAGDVTFRTHVVDHIVSTRKCTV